MESLVSLRPLMVGALCWIGKTQFRRAEALPWSHRPLGPHQACAGAFSALPEPGSVFGGVGFPRTNLLTGASPGTVWHHWGLVGAIVGSGSYLQRGRPDGGWRRSLEPSAGLSELSQRSMDEARCRFGRA